MMVAVRAIAGADFLDLAAVIEVLPIDIADQGKLIRLVNEEEG